MNPITYDDGFETAAFAAEGYSLLTPESSDSWLSTDAGRQLTADLTGQVCKNYRISQDDALPIVVAALANSHALRAAVLAGHDAGQIERTRHFKYLSAATRKKVYYHLRRYERPSTAADTALARLDAMTPGTVPGQALLAELTRGHVSTVERLPGLTAFNQALLAHAGGARSVLDVGCGVYPVLFPFDGAGAAITRYVAADKDQACLRILESYARVRGDGRLIPTRFDVNDGWQALGQRADTSRFDLAFLLKLVPVLQRSDRAAYDKLMGVPADIIVLSGAARSMTKNRSIERRERAALLSFANAARLSVIEETAVADEYLVVAGRSTGG